MHLSLVAFQRNTEQLAHSIVINLGSKTLRSRVSWRLSERSDKKFYVMSMFLFLFRVSAKNILSRF